jgi:hypothetical protein
MSPIEIIKVNGKRELFNPEKLKMSLLRAGANEATIAEVMDAVESHLEPNMTTSHVYDYAFRVLHKLSKSLAVKYSLKRAIMDLGPDGFPFEKFIAEIFKAKGYETLTDQVVQGECVEHEMDVVAWNEKELIMVEAKFHNELGYKSDIKVALYMKARFDDLKESTFSFGDEKRKMTKSLLITNTKFTDHAIRYGQCQGLNMIGWNYPSHGNLQDLIEETGIHPITALSSISVNDKKYLLKNGVILCRDVLKFKDKLVGFGIDKRKVPELIDEASTMCN